MIQTSIRVVTLLSAFFWGSFHCKNYIDKSPYAERTHERAVEKIDKLIAQFMLLNKNIAISQFFQFQMIYCYADIGLPRLGGADPINLKKAKIQKKYMLRNIHEYFDIDKYYALMRLSLEFDPDNFYTRQFGTYSALNRPMVMRAKDVLESIYPRHPQWRYACDIACIYFFELRDFERARYWFKEAMEFPDCPPGMVNIYNATLMPDKKYDIIIRRTQIQLENSEDPRLRQTLEHKLSWLGAMQFLVIKSMEYKERYGRDISSLDDLVRTGLINGIPEDTLGEGFYWDSKLGEPISKGNPFESLDRESSDTIFIED